MYFLYFHLCLLTTYFINVHSYVLLAANLEDFRSIAKKLPKQITERIVRIAQRKRNFENENVEENEDSEDCESEEISDTDNLFNREEREILRNRADSEKEESHEASKEGIEIADPYADLTAPKQAIKRSGSLLTLEEIVQRVKEQLETDLITKMKSEIINAKINNKNKKQEVKDEVLEEDDDDSSEEAISIDPAPTTPKSIQMPIVKNKLRKKRRPVRKPVVRQLLNPQQSVLNLPVTNQIEFATPQPKIVAPQFKIVRVGSKGKKSKLKIKRVPATTQQPLYYYEEEDDTTQVATKIKDGGDMFETIDLGKPNDSYQDYVTPGKDDNFEAAQSASPVNVHDNLKRELLKKIQARQFPEVKTTTVATATVQNVNNPVNEEEYIESREVVTQPELHAVTSKLTSTEDKPAAPDVSTTATKKTTDKRMNFGTFIPTRDAFKLSSPNYYASLPTIAEKYDFNEPIPEKDRVPENLKQIGLPPSKINGKVKVAQSFVNKDV